MVKFSLRIGFMVRPVSWTAGSVSVAWEWMRHFPSAVWFYLGFLARSLCEANTITESSLNNKNTSHAALVCVPSFLLMSCLKNKETKRKDCWRRLIALALLFWWFCEGLDAALGCDLPFVFFLFFYSSLLSCFLCFSLPRVANDCSSTSARFKQYGHYFS